MNDSWRLFLKKMLTFYVTFEKQMKEELESMTRFGQSVLSFFKNALWYLIDDMVTLVSWQRPFLKWIFLSLLLFHRFSTAHGVEPRVDQISNIRDVSARQENGIVTITFTRPIVSTDTVDDRSLENCTFFMYGWGGPVSFDAQNRPTIGYHPSTPIVSNERICLPTVAQCPG